MQKANSDQNDNKLYEVKGIELMNAYEELYKEATKFIESVEPFQIPIILKQK